jgi:excisionase family DNA binding protein
MSDLPRISVRVKEAAEALGCSVDHIWDLIESGDLRTSKSGRMRLVEYASLVEHFENGRVA